MESNSSSVGLGYMAAFAVTGSVVLIARQVHKRLLSDFMKKMEFELAGSKRSCEDKKRVRFADDVVEPSSNNKEYRRRHLMGIGGKDDHRPLMRLGDHAINYGQKQMESMPLNRQMLYKGIIEYRTLKGYNDNSTCF